MDLRRDQSGIRHPFEAPPKPGEAIEVAEGILWMRLPLPMALDHVNVFALAESDGWTLIDTGMNTRRARETWEPLLSGPLNGRPVRRVIVTHYHPDHIGLAGWFQARGADLWTTRTSWLFARMLTLDVHDRPVPETVAFWRGAGMSEEMIARKEGERPFNFADSVHALPLGYRRLVEADRVTFGGRRWTVRMGDGHAPEHATFWSEDGALVIGGDQLLPGISPNLGVYATEPDADPVGDWIASCNRLAPFATGTQLILPGHKLPFTGLPHRLTQMIANHHGAIERLEAALAQPKTAVDCFSALYQRQIGEAEFGLALAEAVAHLNHLRRAGRVRRETQQDGRWLWHRTT